MQRRPSRKEQIAEYQTAIDNAVEAAWFAMQARDQLLREEKAEKEEQESDQQYLARPGPEEQESDQQYMEMLLEDDEQNRQG